MAEEIAIKTELDIEDVKKVFAVLVEGGNVAEKLLKAQGTIAKLSCLLPLADEVFALTGVNWKQLKAEFKNLKDAAKKAELAAFFKQKFDLENDSIESKIEAGFDLLIELEISIEKIIAFAKSFKK